MSTIHPMPLPATPLDEEALRLLADDNPAGMLVHRRHKALYVNAAWAEPHGFTVAEVMAMRSLLDFVAPEDRARVQTFAADRMAGIPAPDRYTYQGLHRNGRRMWNEALVRLINWQGEPAVLVTIVKVDEERDPERIAAMERVRREHLLYLAVLSQVQDRISVIGADYRYRFANQRTLDYYKLSLPDMIGKHVVDVIGSQRFARGRPNLDHVLRGGSVAYIDDSVGSDGEARWVDVTMHPFRSDGVRIDGVVVTVSDITDSRRAMDALKESERRLSTLMSNLPGLAYRAKGLPSRSITEFLSEGCKALTGYRPEEARAMEGGFLLAITHPEDRERTARGVLEARATGRAFQLRYRIVTRTGEVRWVWEHGRVSTLDDGSDMIEGFVSDISEAQQLSEKLEHQARHDPLTDLLNRRAFEDLLDEVVTRTRETQRQAALLYLDLDRFKVVNDACGHVAGDELLRQITARMRLEVRQRDVLARLGGDEFALLLEHCPMGQATQVAEKLRESIQDFRFVWQGQAFSVGASIGVVPIDAGVGGASELLVRADNACYAAKDRGRDRVYVYRTDDEGVHRMSGQTRWLGRIESTLNDDSPVLLADAIVPAATPDAVADHFEVLLRMPDEDGQLVPPGGFMPVAERHGLAGRIDRWVVSRVLEHLAGSVGSARMSINISARSISDESFVSFVRSELARTGVAGRRLGFEVTETLAITILSSASDFSRKLRSLGCVFCLDEFGSGISSFDFLKALPVDYVKIDERHLHGAEDSPVDRAMLRSITRTGQVLEKRVIATSVNDLATLERVRDLGVDLVQGAAVGTPLPLTRIV